MKIYEALKEMVENKKVIKNLSTGALYKYQQFDGIGPLILKNISNKSNQWESHAYFILSIRVIEGEWEVYEGKDVTFDPFKNMTMGSL